MEIKFKSFAFLLFIVLFSGSNCANSAIDEVLEKISEKSQKQIFKAFHYLHKKTYKLNSMEGLNRYRIFKKNVKWAKEQNEKLGKKMYGITQFMDLTHEEFIEKHLLNSGEMEKNIREMDKKSLRFLEENDQKSNNSDNHDEHHHDHHDHHHCHHDDNCLHHDHKKNPDNHNLEKQEKENSKINENKNLSANITDIDHMQYESHTKDQGGCGSCWAFAAIGAIENQYHKLTGKLTVFSEQYLINCDNVDHGCKGGWPTNTFDWISKNGIIKADLLKYKQIQEQCDTTLEIHQYKIVKGYEAYYSYKPQSEWDDLLKKGPMVVAMDASFEGFQFFKSDHMQTVHPDKCGDINHAVVVVGKHPTQDGSEDLVVRNSWSSTWGYKGYFKIPRSKDCSITKFGWLPTVYKGVVPSDKPQPKPEPTPETTDCVKLYSEEGFGSKPILTACDSVPALDDYYFYGIKFPDTDSARYLRVIVFPWQECAGDWKMPITENIEHIQREGDTAYTSSLAFVKHPNNGCINFYTSYCHKGEPEFFICDNIKDTQFVNMSKLSQVQGILPDSYSIKSITFYSEPNYLGNAVSIDNNPIYNMMFHWEIGSLLESGEVRSIKIMKY